MGKSGGASPWRGFWITWGIVLLGVNALGLLTTQLGPGVPQVLRDRHR